MQPIPWLSIHEYATATGMDEEQREDLFHFVGVLDACWLDYHDRKQRQGKKHSEPGTVRKTNRSPRG